MVGHWETKGQGSWDNGRPLKGQGNGTLGDKRTGKWWDTGKQRDREVVGHWETKGQGSGGTLGDKGTGKVGHWETKGQGSGGTLGDKGTGKVGH